MEKTTPHDPEAESERLRAENAQLRSLLVEFLRVVKEVEFNLRKALDKDRKKD